MDMMKELEEIIKIIDKHPVGFSHITAQAISDWMDKEGYVKKIDDEELKNPYPESVFKEPTKKQYQLFHKILQEHGLTLDKFSGAMGRMVWDNCIKTVTQLGYIKPTGHFAIANKMVCVCGGHTFKDKDGIMRCDVCGCPMIHEPTDKPQRFCFAPMQVTEDEGLEEIIDKYALPHTDKWYTKTLADAITSAGYIKKSDYAKFKEYYEGDGKCQKCGIPLMPPSCAECDFGGLVKKSDIVVDRKELGKLLQDYFGYEDISITKGQIDYLVRRKKVWLKRIIRGEGY